MSFWTQDATGKPKPVNLTFGPLIDRPLWTQWDKAFVGSDGDEHYPATFLWASRLNPIISFDVIAVQYGSQSSSIARIRQDHMTLDMRRIQEHEKNQRHRGQSRQTSMAKGQQQRQPIRHLGQNRRADTPLSGRREGTRP